MLFGWAAALAVAVSACDSPTLNPVAAPAESTRLIAPATGATATADTARRAELFPRCTVGSSWCEGIDTIKIAQPGSDSVGVRVFDETSKTKIVVGGDTVTFQLGILDVQNETGGDFIYMIWKDGQFVGFFGHCVFGDGNNKEYITTDSTGKQLIHMENSHKDPNNNELYHYIYDPATNTLKIYHRNNGETTGRLIYNGPPIKDVGNLPPADPPAGQGPYTSESQISGTTGTTGTGTTGTGTTGTTGMTSTPGTTGGTPTSPTTTTPSTTTPSSPSPFGTTWSTQNVTHGSFAGAA